MLAYRESSVKHMIFKKRKLIFEIGLRNAAFKDGSQENIYNCKRIDDKDNVVTARKYIIIRTGTRCIYLPDMYIFNASNY